MGHFYYLDLILQDSPIFIKSEYEKIRGIFPESDAFGNRSIEDRRQTVTVFANYLEQRESAEIKSRKHGDPGLDALIVKDYIRPKLEADFERMDRRISAKGRT